MKHYNKWSRYFWIFLLVAGLTPFQASQGRAQDDNSSLQDEVYETDLSDALCRDVLILSGVDRDVTIAFMHGVLVGQSGNLIIKPDVLAETTDDFLRMCLDDPDSKALDMLAKSMAAE